MSNLLEKALERVRAWPRARQDDLARIALDMDEQGVTPHVLSEEERRVLETAWRESEAEDFASEEEIKAAYDRFDR